MRAVIGWANRVAAVTFVAGLAGCGWYTNVPAQVHVQSVDPGTVNVVFNGSNAPAFTNPTVTAVGEPGSIGVTYVRAQVAYLDSSGKAALNTDMGINLRVEASTLSTIGGQTNSTTGTTMTGGTGKAVFPIVTQGVLDYAKGHTNGALSAQVTMTGQDDARYPASVVFYVPIVFSGQ